VEAQHLAGQAALDRLDGYVSTGAEPKSLEGRGQVLLLGVKQKILRNLKNILI
jgi:hypothetical protein